MDTTNIHEKMLNYFLFSYRIQYPSSWKIKGEEKKNRMKGITILPAKMKSILVVHPQITFLYISNTS